MDGWIGHKGPLGRNRRWTNPRFPGIEVRHCGHPTALRPYYVPGVAGTFRLLLDAKSAAEEFADQRSEEQR